MHSGWRSPPWPRASFGSSCFHGLSAESLRRRPPAPRVFLGLRSNGAFSPESDNAGAEERSRVGDSPLVQVGPANDHKPGISQPTLGAGLSAADYFIGTDVGSTTVKTVLVDPSTQKILWSRYERHETRQAATVAAQLEALQI